MRVDLSSGKKVGDLTCETLAAPPCLTSALRGSVVKSVAIMDTPESGEAIEHWLANVETCVRRGIPGHRRENVTPRGISIP